MCLCVCAFRNAVAPSPAAQTIKKSHYRKLREEQSWAVRWCFLALTSLVLNKEGAWKKKTPTTVCFSNTTWQWPPSLTPMADRLAVWVEEGAGWMGAQGSIERSGGKDGGRCTQRKRQKRQRQKDFCIFARLQSLRAFSSDGCILQWYWSKLSSFIGLFFGLIFVDYVSNWKSSQSGSQSIHYLDQ